MLFVEEETPAIFAYVPVKLFAPLQSAKPALFTLKYDYFEKLKISNAIEMSIITNINQCEVRDLVNEPVNQLNSITYLKHIQKSLSKYKNIKIKVYNQEKLKKMGMNLILAVNKGSVNPPMLVVLEYKNSDNKDDKNICLVGKGVMFDTGGINIKYDEFYDMKSDMAGSALVFGVIKTLADLNIKKNVVGILPLVENDVDGKATHPGDIVKSYSGKTVEILNTDAEGRLILADAIYYCKNYNPKIIIDIATLTGQVAEIFDNIATGIMSNDIKTIEQFKNRSLDNFNNRCLHHYVYNDELLMEICNYFKCEFIYSKTQGLDRLFIMKKV